MFNLLRNFYIKIITTLLLTAAATTTNAAMLEYDTATNKYTGISGIEINDELWNASFLTAPFEVSGAQVYEEGFAIEATVAMFNTVQDQFKNQLFDTNPELIRGCYSLLFCELATAIDVTGTSNLSIDVYSFVNTNPMFYYDHHVRYTVQSPVNGTLTYVNWDKQVSAVPVPAAVWLMGSGGLGLMGFSRYTNTRSAVA